MGGHICLIAMLIPFWRASEKNLFSFNDNWYINLVGTIVFKAMLASEQKNLSVTFDSLTGVIVAGRGAHLFNSDVNSILASERATKNYTFLFNDDWNGT